MNFNRKILIIIAISAISVTVPLTTFAQGTNSGGGSLSGSSGNSGGGGVSGVSNVSGGGAVSPNTTATLQNPLQVNSIGGLVQKFVEILSYVAIMIAVLALIYVGFLYVMSQGKPEKRKELNAWLLYIVIGAAVVLAARLIVNVVINTLEASGVSKEVTNSARSAANGN